MRIAVIGVGNVGGALGIRWAEAGHAVRFGVRDPRAPKVVDLLTRAGHGSSAALVGQAAEDAEVVVLATSWGGTHDAIVSAGDLSGKVVLDATNPIKADLSGLETDGGKSGGEMVAEWSEGARVVKAFNTVGANVMSDPAFGATQAALFYCGNDAAAKDVASRLASDIGFEPIDVGPLEQARLLEPLAWLWVTMAMRHGYGREMAFALLRR